MTFYMQNPLVLNPEYSPLPYAFADAALLHALFALTSLYRDLSVGTKITPLCLMHKGEMLRIINERITKTPLQLSDGTIGAVTALATFDASHSVNLLGRALTSVISYWMADYKTLVGIFEGFNAWWFKEVAYKLLEKKPGRFVEHRYCKGLYAGKNLKPAPT
ncbi:uncharacterized protein T069G_10998 [Trichoderma breve]|uniref:Uncharacterized protein n=1 Tax=Trichoderma breve TaxID=2034170 RepID=A0A9W9E3A0_9HYPO|nr:uncharacterized protein T069G_10998 [Trichoderma breve]KAJ4855440.1 hypothetical protein T069G_10998 [Trichoderma breve]